MRNLRVITIVLALMIGFAGLAESQEVIGEIIFPSGYPGHIAFIQGNEYQLVSPYGQVWRVSIAPGPKKFIVVVGETDAFQSTPPYKRWIWIRSDGTEEVLPEASIGHDMCTMIYQHYIKMIPQA